MKVVFESEKTGEKHSLEEAAKLLAKDALKSVRDEGGQISLPVAGLAELSVKVCWIITEYMSQPDGTGNYSATGDRLKGIKRFQKAVLTEIFTQMAAEGIAAMEAARQRQQTPDSKMN